MTPKLSETVAKLTNWQRSQYSRRLSEALKKNRVLSAEEKEKIAEECLALVHWKRAKNEQQ